jgi:DNA-binding IclR family transcriptional regulator
MPTIFQIEFGLHVPPDSIDSMLTGMASNGLLRREGESRRYTVDVPRRARAESLEKQLKGYASYGFLTFQVKRKKND